MLEIHADTRIGSEGIFGDGNGAPATQSNSLDYGNSNYSRMASLALSATLTGSGQKADNKGGHMSEQAQALGALLIEIADLAGAAEDHGIVGNPTNDVLGPLIEQAQKLGVDVAPPASLADLHLAVEAAAQGTDDDQVVESGAPVAAQRASQSGSKLNQGFADPLPQVAPLRPSPPASLDDFPNSEM